MTHSNYIHHESQDLNTDSQNQTNKLQKHSNSHLISIGSLNTHGINNNTGYINELAMQTNILFISETQSTSQLSVENIIYNDSKKIFSKNAIKNKKSGRGSCGLAFLVDKNLKTKVNFISRRIGQLKLNNLCVIGVYLSANDNSQRSIIDLEAELELAFQTVQLRKKEGYNCLIIGDFNIDVSKTSPRSNLLLNLLNQHSYEISEKNFPISIDYTWQMVRKKKHSEEIEIVNSFVDHVLAPLNSKEIQFIDIINDPGNNSDHNFIQILYSLDSSIEMDDVFTKEKKAKTVYNWDDPEFVANFRNRTQQKLRTGALKAHNELNLTIRSQKNSNRNKKNFWWSVEIKEIYANMKYHYVIYRDSGFKEELKSQYTEQKKLFRTQKRFNIQLRRDKNLRIINDLFNTDKTKFWRKVKKLNKNNNQIDAKLDDIKNQYEKIFNDKNQTDKSKNDEAKDKFNEILETFRNTGSDPVKLDKHLIRDKIKDLSNRKAIGLTGVSNEMLKYGLQTDVIQIENDSLLIAITSLFEGMINHSYCPPLFNTSIIKPIIKDLNKPSDDINNLRGVAVSDVIQNLYESILESIVRKQVKLNKKQFGFRPNYSCAHAVLILKQCMLIAKHYRRRLYIAAIDASKAFDKVNRSILWIELLENGVSLKIVIAIHKYYEKSLMLVDLDGELSSLFKTTLGVRQGGVLSPLLFIIYINNLLKSIEELEIGTRIGNLLIDILAYADDILLIAETKIDLQLLLDKLSSVGSELEIKFNPSKSVYMVFNPNCFRSSNELAKDAWNGALLLSGSPIEKVNEFRYLGVETDENNKNTPHIAKRKKSVLASVGKLQSIGLTNYNIHPSLQADMFKTNIRPILMYGFENLVLNKTELKTIKRIEGNALKRVLGISTKCKSTDLYNALNILPPAERLNWIKLKQFVRFTLNDYTNEFLNTIDRLNIPNTLTNEVRQLTETVVLPRECDLKERCLVSIQDIMDTNEEESELNKNSMLLKLLFNLSNRDEMKIMIEKVLEADRFYYNNNNEPK